MSYLTYRPDGCQGQADSRLPQITRRLLRCLTDTQRQFAFDSLRLKRPALRQLAGILVDFAEDLHNDIGIWKAYERHNGRFFGVSLPLIETNSGDGSESALSADRLRHLLWVLYPEFIDGLIVSPAHRDIERLAEATSRFLADAFQDVPRDSGVKAFLQTPHGYGWDVKRKLIWLGCGSYMFRLFFANYMSRNTGKKDTLGRTDDFLCQECTRWSGLGAIDILAEVLDISADARDELRSWYERHVAFYKVLTVSRDALEVLNVVNDRTYRIKLNMERAPFTPGQFLFGSLVPWRGDWYWSGEQKAWPDASAVNVEEVKQDMKRRSSRIVCRCCPEYAAQVRERASNLHKAVLEYYGKDLIVYRDGMSMAADWQKELRWHWDSHPSEEVRDVIQRHGLTRGRPSMNIPQDLLEHNDGIGVFLNPDEGKEIMTHFKPLVAGLKRRGENLTAGQQEAIQGFFRADSISPQFVQRLLAEYGDESVRAAYFLKGELPSYWLDFLLRSHKGRYYRNRYPTLGIVG